ncbi:MAG: CrcB family protein [Rhodoluna sp.]|nr:CrcB family protein [Rhodoluna sp.]
MVEFLIVAAFGGVGALARGLLSKFNGYLPWGILLANTIATAIAAWALVASPQLQLILVAGLAGGLSTFSTFVQQTWQLIIDGRKLASFLNVLLNLVVPSTAVALVMLCL